MSFSVTLCIPTLNPGADALRMVDALERQTRKPDQLLVIDSSSNDGSVDIFRRIGAQIIVIERADFDHGGTRNIAFRTGDPDICIFLTQDAIPVRPDALEKLVQALIDEPDCGVVYGRQVAMANAGLFAKHARLYNYPDGGGVQLRSAEDIPRLGIKAAFCSDSFAAYRTKAMRQIGYFSDNTLFAEDTIAAASFLKEGWKVAYVPEAMVEHSHDYSLKQDFRRYFDVGAFHALNSWYTQMLGRAEGEGVRFVRSEYLFLKQGGARFPLYNVVVRNGFRWMGYRFGKLHRWIPHKLIIKISTNRAYWSRK